MARIPLMAGNWKMNKTVEEAVDLVKQLKAAILGVKEVEVAVAPAFTALHAVSKELKDSTVRLAAQNVFWEEKGAFTGEVSPLMLKEMGCVYVIVGHSERRQFFAETDKTVNCRMKTVIAHGMKPIFCIGEMLKEREENRTFSVVERQIEGGLRDIKENEVKTVVIAYEPVWAIGTGKTATPQQAEEVHRFIRQKLERLYSQGMAEAVRIQYGGSVTPENVKGLMDQEDIDGALVGGASLKSDSFSKIVRFREI